MSIPLPLLLETVKDPSFQEVYVKESNLSSENSSEAPRFFGEPHLTATGSALYKRPISGLLGISTILDIAFT